MEDGETMAEDRKLTPLQQRFVTEYCRLGNATEAARAAGCCCKNQRGFEVSGSRMLRNVEVARAIEKANARRNDRLELAEDFELQKAIRVLEMCMEPKQVVDSKGLPVVDEETGKFVMSFDSKGANTAIQTIAKLRGKFVTKIQVGLADDLDVQLGRIPDANES